MSGGGFEIKRRKTGRKILSGSGEFFSLSFQLCMEFHLHIFFIVSLCLLDFFIWLFSTRFSLSLSSAKERIINGAHK